MTWGVMRLVNKLVDHYYVCYDVRLIVTNDNPPTPPPPSASESPPPDYAPDSP
jgi:hypothetical protein